MQTTDNFEVTRRAPDIEDFVDMLRRHKTWVFGPFWAGIVIATVVAFLWPDTYVSSALIRVTSSQVPDRYVQTNLNQLLGERISAISQGVLSRSTLTNIIQTHDLYPRERRRLPMEDIIETMRLKHIKIGMVNLQNSTKSIGAFPISFQYENRFLAQKVTQDIVSRLINENERETMTQSQTTTDFLTTEVVKAKQQLDEIEAKLADFKIRNVGTLPDDQSINFSAMNSLDQRISQMNASISRLTQDKLLMESNLRISREQLAKATEAASVAPQDAQRAHAKNEELAQKNREITSLENALTQYKEMYTESHPEIRRIVASLSVLRRQRDELLKLDKEAQAEELRKAEAAEKSKAPRRIAPTKEMQILEANIKQMEVTIQGKTTEIQELTAEIARTSQQAKAYQGRITSAPLSGQAYALLTRDYEQAKSTYNGLKRNQDDSARGTAIIRNKQGETLELLDQASLPVTPSEPKRAQIIGAGAAAGLMLGILLVAVREMKDTTLKNLKDVRAYTQLTVLGCVPLLEGDIVVKRRKRVGLLGWSTAILLGVLVMGGSVAYYFAATS
jgi:succinoglycan biosynthesis transport protein ExoP